jgi:hypothetical protein
MPIINLVQKDDDMRVEVFTLDYQLGLRRQRR